MSNRSNKRRKAKKTRAPILRPLASKNPWNVHQREFDEWFRWIDDLEVTEIQRQSLQNLHEAIVRLANKRDNLQALRRRLPKHHRGLGGIKLDQQYEIFDATEAFFQTFYAVLSTLAAACARFSSVFGQPPTSSMSKYIEWLNVRFKTRGHFDFLQVARAFRAVLDHSEQFPPYDWKTVTHDGGPMRIVLLGPTSRGGSVPPGSVRREFADGAGWDFVAPFEDFVFTMTALAARCCLWQLAEWSRGDPLTTPIVKISGDPIPEGDAGQTEHSDSWARVVAINGSPDTIPNWTMPESYPNPYHEVSFGRGSRDANDVSKFAP